MNASHFTNDLQRAHVEISGQEVRSMLGQLNARAYLEARKVPEGEWPRFDPNLTQDAYQKAQEYLYSGVRQVLGKAGHESRDSILEEAGELFEKIFATAQSVTPEERSLGLFHAAIAYYLSGQYARAYVIMKDLEDLSIPPYPWELLKRFFLKDLLKLRDDTLEILLHPQARDERLAEALRKGEIRETEAVNWVLESTLSRALSLVREHIETGHPRALEGANRLLDLGHQLSSQRRLFNWWALMFSARAILEEYRQNSLWAILGPLLNEDSSGVVRSYCLGASKRRPPITELWRTQVQAFPHINELARRSYCIKMPTSSGKTQIAEMSILRFLVDNANDLTKKCIYIAPFRALAAELEQSFKASLGSIGVGITELYGGFDLTPVDMELFENAKVIIATPEKVDALLRYRPELAEQIELIVIDEGHIIESGSRGLKYELFLHRVIRRFTDKGVRTFFISAVMPSPEQFTTWIANTNPEQGLITSSWRASRLRLGTLVWDGNSARIDYLYNGFERISGPMFITGFVHSLPTPELRKARAERHVFPSKDLKREQVALAAIEAARNGPTLVFASQPRWANSVAESILCAISLKSALKHGAAGCEYQLPHKSDEQSLKQWEDCISFACETAGSNSLVTRSLRAGFILHHADIPKALRARLEALARDGIVSLTVATSTLAQGVNLPLRTVLIHSLAQGERQSVSVIDFWNICGRAGRALKENEGHVLLCTDSRNAKEAKQQLKHYVDQANVVSVISSVRSFLERTHREWAELHPGADVAELCTYLAENRIDWMSQDQARRLDALDSQLLALLEETQDFNMTPQGVQDLFERSLLFLQLNTDMPGNYLAESQVVDMLLSRIVHIHKVAPAPEQRRQFYRTGLVLPDCAYLLNHRESIIEILAESNDYLNWDSDARAEYLVRLCTKHMLQLSDIRPDQSRNLVDCWPRLLYLWLYGNTAEQMEQDQEIARDQLDAMKISSLIDDLFDYRFPWGFSSLFAFLDWESDTESWSWGDSDKANNTSGIPAIARYFPSMIQYGVHSPIAAIVMRLGLRSRMIASILSEHYAGEFSTTDIRSWLSALTESELDNWGVDTPVRSKILDFVKHMETPLTGYRTEELEEFVFIAAKQQYLVPITAGSTLILKPAGPSRVEVYSSAGEYLDSRSDDILYGLICDKPQTPATVQGEPKNVGNEQLELRFSLRHST